MNTKSLLTRIGVPVLSLGLLGGLGATLAISASAATIPHVGSEIVQVTHISHRVAAAPATGRSTNSTGP